MAKIAVVEDNDAMRAQLCGFIAQYAQESGHQLDVTAFSDGAQLVEPYRPGFDIIFLDIEMPTLGGMPTVLVPTGGDGHFGNTVFQTVHIASLAKSVFTK